MKRVIINADDFGVSKGANRGIMEAFKSGSITSASLMTNMGDADSAAALSLQYGLKVGFHLCLSAGKPLSDPGKVSTLTDPEGNFWPRSRLIKKVFTGRISMTQVEREFEMQIERFFDLGISPDHLNTDQHVHLLPGIQEISIMLAKKYKVPLRIPDERIIFSSWLPGKSFITKKIPMKLLACRLRFLCKKEAVQTNDHLISIFGFVGSRLSNRQQYVSLLKYIRPGITEVMVHPAYSDKTLEAFWIGGFSQGREREEELKSLLSEEFRQALEESDISLTTYSQIYSRK